MLLDNIKMADNFCRAYSESSGIKYLLYVSSDAVFADSNELISESYFKAPDSLHGVMHLAREICFSNLGVGLGVIRPTLVYGPGDPHNGYGPNKFMRLVNEGKDVVLFGKGEERRDHIFIGDVAEIAVRMVEGNICESFNAVSGEVISFADVAKRVVTYRQSSVRIIETGRNGPMPHGGYRAFDNRKIFQFFPDIKISKFDDSLFS
jgi:nucleoside-diphosphate-sugar epimerase